MFHKVANVEPLPAYMLRVKFQSGDIKLFDVSRLFDQWEAFKALQDTPGLFGLVRVDAGGYGISWNDYIDLECNDLWEYGTECPRGVNITQA